MKTIALVAIGLAIVLTDVAATVSTSDTADILDCWNTLFAAAAAFVTFALSIKLSAGKF